VYRTRRPAVVIGAGLEATGGELTLDYAPEERPLRFGAAPPVEGEVLIEERTVQEIDVLLIAEQGRDRGDAVDG
jgi:hypothetical protein